MEAKSSSICLQHRDQLDVCPRDKAPRWGELPLSPKDLFLFVSVC